MFASAPAVVCGGVGCMSGLWRALLAVCFATLAFPPGAHAAAWLPAIELRPIATDFGEDLAFNASGDAGSPRRVRFRIVRR